jgi:hypothetical protein
MKDHTRILTHSLHCLVAIPALAALSMLPLSAAAQDLPKRKSGLWEIKMDNSAAKSAAPGMGPRTMTQCVDAAKDDIARQAGQQMEKENKCTQGKMQQSGGTISFDSSCEFGGTKMTSHTTITGDFSSAYRMEIKSKFEPPMMGMADTTTIMDAKYVGACKPGMRPGDVEMMGMKMNVYDMMDNSKKK